jgi:hypothetical protein
MMPDSLKLLFDYSGLMGFSWDHLTPGYLPDLELFNQVFCKSVVNPNGMT